MTTLRKQVLTKVEMMVGKDLQLIHLSISNFANSTGVYIMEKSISVPMSTSLLQLQLRAVIGRRRFERHADVVCRICRSATISSHEYLDTSKIPYANVRDQNPNIVSAYLKHVLCMS